MFDIMLILRHFFTRRAATQAFSQVGWCCVQGPGCVLALGIAKSKAEVTVSHEPTGAVCAADSVMTSPLLSRCLDACLVALTRMAVAGLGSSADPAWTYEGCGSRMTGGTFLSFASTPPKSSSHSPKL